MRESPRIDGTLRPGPADPRRYLHVAKILPGPAYLFGVWSEAVFGVQVHYKGQETGLCRLDPDLCSWDHSKNRPRWQGYLVGLQWPTLAPRLIQLTEGAWRNCEALQKYDGALRGVLLEVSRMGRTANSPLKVSVRPELFAKVFPNLPTAAEAVGRLFSAETV